MIRKIEQVRFAESALKKQNSKSTLLYQFTVPYLVAEMGFEREEWVSVRLAYTTNDAS